MFISAFFMCRRPYLWIRDDLDLTELHDPDHGVGGPQVNPNGCLASHLNISVMKMKPGDYSEIR